MTRMDFDEAKNLLLLAVAHVRDEPHAEHSGPFCPVCGLVGAADRFIREWRPAGEPGEETDDSHT